MLRFANVATPPAAACVSVPASVPPAGLVPIATVTGPVKLGTAFPNASRALTTTAGVIAAPAPVVLGCPVNASALAAPATTVTAAVCVTVTPAIADVTVFVPTTVELTLPVATPFASVATAGCVSVFPVPVAVSTTAAPLIGFPKPSRAVTVSVATLVPEEAVIAVGDAASVDCVADGAPAVTLKPPLVAGVRAPELATSV